MCGIVGVIGRDACGKVFSGLKSLEYRGYDSWGVCFPKGKEIENERHTGKISDAGNSFPENPELSLGHTRWATHGGISEKNAHPHLSNNGQIALVHNGIVENFSALKKALASKGFKFYSETDSEVIVNLIQGKTGKAKSFEEAVRLALLEIEGSYAIAAIRLGEKKIVCARNGSPLVLGIGGENNEKVFFAASDASAFISSTKKAIFLEDDSMAVLDSGVNVYSVASGKKMPFKIRELKWDARQAQKGNYAHFMLKEISEQPETIARAIEQPEQEFREFVSAVNGAKNIFITGCGTSFHACLSASYFFSAIAKKQAVPVLASEFSNYAPLLGKGSLVIGVSQSGETADVLEALKRAKASGAKIAGIVNVMDSSVMRLSNYSLLMNSGPEICVLSTKTFTSQLALLLLLAFAVAGREKEGRELILETARQSKKILGSNAAKAEKLAKTLAQKQNIFVIGRGLAFPAALESALKIKEVSYIHAEGFAGGELKHGSIALIEEGVPAIVLSTPETAKEVESNAIEMKSRGAFIISAGSVETEQADYAFALPGLGYANPIALVLPMQLLAYRIALEKNLDPDRPRNLAKSVTVK